MSENISDEMVLETVITPLWEETLIIRVQNWGAKYPFVDKIATAFSLFGEHSLGWLLLSFLGAMGTKSSFRRKIWFELALNTFGAHAISVVIKRLVRRPRPRHPYIRSVETAGRYSFPSSHSSAAAAGVCTLVRYRVGPRVMHIPLILPLMIHARMHKGVHYLSDLGAGAALGTIFHLSLMRYMRKRSR